MKRLIEDLLTIPDIEGMRLRTNIESVWLVEVLETSKLLLKNKDNKEIIINIKEDFPNVTGDKLNTLIPIQKSSLTPRSLTIALKYL